MGWIAFGVTFVVALSLGFIVRRRYQDDLAELEASSKAQLEDVKHDARGRVDRLERESSRQKHDARDGLVKDLLPAFDALMAARDHAGDPELTAGLDLVHAQLTKGLGRHDIAEIAPEPGAAFDPNLHEAVESIETDEIPSGAVARCHRVGYLSGDKTLRPAMVGVAKAPAATPRDEEE